MRQAEIQLVRHVQRQAFPEEYRVLGSLTPKETATGVRKDSPILRLAPVMSSDGVLLVGGRLVNAPVQEDSRHQMILPKGHHMVDLIVRECHEESGHGRFAYGRSLGEANTDCQEGSRFSRQGAGDG